MKELCAADAHAARAKCAGTSAPESAAAAACRIAELECHRRLTALGSTGHASHPRRYVDGFLHQRIRYFPPQFHLLKTRPKLNSFSMSMSVIGRLPTIAILLALAAVTGKWWNLSFFLSFCCCPCPATFSYSAGWFMSSNCGRAFAEEGGWQLQEPRRLLRPPTKETRSDQRKTDSQLLKRITITFILKGKKITHNKMQSSIIFAAAAARQIKRCKNMLGPLVTRDSSSAGFFFFFQKAKSK